MVNLGAEGKLKIIIEGVKNTETWKAVRGYWNGGKKEGAVEVVL